MIDSLLKNGFLNKTSLGNETLLSISEDSMKTVVSLSDKYKIVDSGKTYLLLKRGKKTWKEEPSSGPVPKNKAGLSLLRNEYNQLIS